MDATTSPANKRAILFVVSTVSSLVMLDSNIVAVALPTISRSLNADFGEVQWVITAYVLPFAALLLPAGSFSDKVGRRLAAVMGMAIFAFASLFCGSATSPLILDLSRAVQGVGASLVMTSSLALINHIFQGGERAKAFAFWGSTLGIAITCGPIIGGVISSVFGWQWAFLINIPICIALIAGILKLVPESRDPDAKGLDYPGIGTFSSGLFLLTWAVIDGNAVGWLTATVLIRLVFGVALLMAFIAVERRVPRPMFDLGLFRSKTFVGAAFAMMGYAAGAQVMIFYLPLYLQNAFGLSPMSAGISMLPFALPMFLIPRLIARFHWSQSFSLGIGLTITAVADLALALLAHWDVPYTPFAIGMLAAGIGAGILNGETAKAMQGAIPASRAGMSSGIGGTTRFTILLFGVAALGAILVATATNRFAPLAQRLGIEPSRAADLSKRFSAGDAAAALHAIPDDLKVSVGNALREAFQSGFAYAALAAAGVAVASLLLTLAFYSRDSAPAPVGDKDEAMFVAGE